MKDHYSEIVTYPEGDFHPDNVREILLSLVQRQPEKFEQLGGHPWRCSVAEMFKEIAAARVELFHLLHMGSMEYAEKQCRAGQSAGRKCASPLFAFHSQRLSEDLAAYDRLLAEAPFYLNRSDGDDQSQFGPRPMQRLLQASPRAMAFAKKYRMTLIVQEGRFAEYRESPRSWCDAIHPFPEIPWSKSLYLGNPKQAELECYAVQRDFGGADKETPDEARWLYPMNWGRYTVNPRPPRWTSCSLCFTWNMGEFDPDTREGCQKFA